MPIRAQTTIKHRPTKASTSAVVSRAVLYPNAITRIASGLLKLVYPHRTSATIQREELDWVLAEAVGLRQRVLDQLAKMAPGEFGRARLSCRLRGVAA